MSKRTYIPTVFLIDDRPGEEMTASANTAEGVAAFKMVCPYLHECTWAEFEAMERRIEALDNRKPS